MATAGLRAALRAALAARPGPPAAAAARRGRPQAARPQPAALEPRPLCQPLCQAGQVRAAHAAAVAAPAPGAATAAAPRGGAEAPRGAAVGTGTGGLTAEELTATADSDVARLGGAIAAAVRQHGRVKIRSVGAKAAYRAIKALVNASEYLREDQGAPKDRVLAAELSEQVVLQNGKDEDAAPEERAAPSAEASAAASPQSRNESQVKRTVMFIEARAMVGLPAVASCRELIVSANTNVGRSAGAIASAIRPAGEGEAAVRAMGNVAVHKAMVSAAMARAYLSNDGRGVRFVVVPSFEEQQQEGASGGRRIKQLVLRMRRTGP